MGQDKEDKEDKVTREENSTKLGSVIKNQRTQQMLVFRKKSSLSTAPLLGGVGGGFLPCLIFSEILKTYPCEPLTPPWRGTGDRRKESLCSKLCHLSLVICHWLFVIGHLSFVICHLLLHIPNS
ncbi:MAG: hypothetical protein F6K31_01250 [Symploca sp. SIO2G7]|nr:hypothetical protein [Symploca sp. SIO2G7]